MPFFCTFVFPHDFLLKFSHSESEVIEIFIVIKKMLLVDFKHVKAWEKANLHKIL